MFSMFGPHNPIDVLAGTGGSTWSCHKTCVGVKQNHEELMVVGCLDIKLDHFEK
jgi:hypothetical protein